MRAKVGYHHGNLPAALIEAALEIIDERGVRALTLREVARRVGVTHAAPYRHFKHKAALLAAVAEAGFRDLAAVISQLRLSDDEREARADGKGGLVSCGVRYLRFAVDHSARFQVMFATDLAEPRTVALRAAGAAMLDEVSRLVAGAQRARLIPQNDNPRVVAELLWAQWHGIALLSAGQWLENAEARSAQARRKLLALLGAAGDAGHR